MLFKVPSRVNGYPVVAFRPASRAPHEICAVILCRRGPDNYVTWTYNVQSSDASIGHYDLTLAAGAADFGRRWGGTFPWWCAGDEASLAEQDAVGAALR
jgi:hypothetical protein